MTAILNHTEHRWQSLSIFLYKFFQRVARFSSDVPAGLGKGQGAKEIGHNLVSRERPKFGHNLVRERRIIGHGLESANDKNSVAIQHVNKTN